MTDLYLTELPVSERPSAFRFRATFWRCYGVAVLLVTAGGIWWGLQ